MGGHTMGRPASDAGGIRTHSTGDAQIMNVGTPWLNHAARGTDVVAPQRNSVALNMPAATGASMFEAVPMVAMSVPGIAAQAGFGAACQQPASSVSAEALVSAAAVPPGVGMSTYPCASGYGAWYGAALQQV